MRRFTGWMALAFAVAGLSACGTTVGDPCTTPKECSDGLCLNKDYTPGGYCTRQCVANDASSCPNGSVCVPEGGGKDLNACFLECSQDSDCRSGYTCRRVRDVQFTVCVGPEGI